MGSKGSVIPYFISIKDKGEFPITDPSMTRFNIPIELLINRMTKLPADKIGLKGRGEIKENNFADLVVFDSEEINDLATFEDPEILSVGINKVFVNGNLAFDKRKEVTELNGYFI